MKTSTPNVRNLLLAAVLAMPLFAIGGAARADELGADQPPMAQGEPGPGPRGFDGDNEGPGGPGGPGKEGPQHRGPQQGGERGGEHGGPNGGPEHGPNGGPGFGPGFGFGPGPGFGGGLSPFFHGVELTEAQEDKIFAILHAEAPYLRDQGKAARKASEALRELAKADKYDDAKAAALAKEAATAEANIALQRVRTEQKLLAVLTPEQRKKQADEKPRHPQRP
ncbi:periplasmic heavy metal sensor [Duganella sp. FT80W]|uniref:Periplasmic heavy metal sensor n=1 Tax=Duganella guangzhouensis TaxID=2666084 RepID=A0A6I2LA48_9BURK|nr:Spy/CpxP family protein refolding chaperone [Duganella guangzhouensis]MRW93694.1 periplasmic heavy metal sensor [Duganella guangzhouensis]